MQQDVIVKGTVCKICIMCCVAFRLSLVVLLDYYSVDLNTTKSSTRGFWVTFTNSSHHAYHLLLTQLNLSITIMDLAIVNIFNVQAFMCLQIGISMSNNPFRLYDLKHLTGRLWIRLKSIHLPKFQTLLSQSNAPRSSGTKPCSTRIHLLTQDNRFLTFC